MNPAVKKSFWILFLICVAFAAGLSVRRTVLNAQYEHYGRPLPFELESALYFRYVRMLVEQGKLPVLDKMVQCPAGIVVKKTYEIGCEYVCAVLSRLFPSTLALDERVRWISAVWFCLGIPALFLWLWWWRASLFGAFLGALFYAVSLASVMRSTGQEISHENFAIPLFIVYLAVSRLAEREKEKKWPFVGLCCLSALFLVCALMLWDLIQFYLLAWVLLAACRVIAGNYFLDGKAGLKWGMVLAALILAGLLNPYLRAHGFIHAPAMLMAYGILLALPWAGRENGKLFVGPPLAARRSDQTAFAPNLRRRLHRGTALIFLRLGLVVLPLILGLFIFNKYSQSYGHFAELLYAKIVFLNHKPSDPALLTFTQRILWAPALNSANILLTKTLFPATLPLFLIATIIFIFNPRWRTDPEITGLLFFSCLSFAAFILFTRLYVFAAVGFAAVIGLLGSWAVQQRSILLRLVLIFLLLGGVVLEAANILRNPLRWGREQPYLTERRELIDWLKAHAAGQPVLANFGISASALAYAGCPIILHPKFESPEIRKRVREYGETLFGSGEGEFRSWADRHGAAFYVYSLGEFADAHPDLQMRYFVNALNPPAGAAARLFEFNPGRARWFEALWQNRKFRVFRIITAADERTARAQVRLAVERIARGAFKDAQKDAELALVYDPGSQDALETLLRIEELRKQ